MPLATQATLQLSFDQFLENYPDDGRYELINGEIVRILATRRHEDISDFVADTLRAQVQHQQLNYRVSDRIVVCTLTSEGQEQGRHPDVSVVDRNVWEANREAYSALREPLQLAIEVVSTNWEDDYVDKLDEYARLGIPEYWIIDYLALDPRADLGNPKAPCIFVFLLNNQGQYERQKFSGAESIISPTFSELSLTVEQLLQI
jgi:Uma2 family endonuclease